MTQKSDNGIIIAIVGKPRKGKSTIAKTIGWMCDRDIKKPARPRFILSEDYFPPNFKLEEGEVMPRLVFKPSHVMRFFADRHPRSSTIVWDETGVEGDARDYMSKKNKLLKRTVETVGSKNFILILTAPSLKSFDTGFRRLVTFIIRAKGTTQKEDGSIWTKASILATKPNELTGDVYFKNLFIREKKFGGKGKVAEYLFPSPPDFLTKPYKRMKELYQNALYTDYKDELEHMDDLNFNKLQQRKDNGNNPKKKLTKTETIIEAIKNNPKKYIHPKGKIFNLAVLKQDYPAFSYAIISDAAQQYKKMVDLGFAATEESGQASSVAPVANG